MASGDPDRLIADATRWSNALRTSFLTDQGHKNVAAFLDELTFELARTRKRLAEVEKQHDDERRRAIHVQGQTTVLEARLHEVQNDRERFLGELNDQAAKTRHLAAVLLGVKQELMEAMATVRHVLAISDVPPNSA